MSTYKKPQAKAKAKAKAGGGGCNVSYATHIMSSAAAGVGQLSAATGEELETRETTLETYKSSAAILLRLEIVPCRLVVWPGVCLPTLRCVAHHRRTQFRPCFRLTFVRPVNISKATSFISDAMGSEHAARSRTFTRLVLDDAVSTGGKKFNLLAVTPVAILLLQIPEYPDGPTLDGL